MWILSDLDTELRAMAESDQYVYKRELAAKLRRGEQGRLTYGADSRLHDVVEIQRGGGGQLLELRHDDVTTVDDTGDHVQRHARLYFTERRRFPGELLSVAFYTKAPGPIGLDEQDQHIDASLGRLLAHERGGS